LRAPRFSATESMQVARADFDQPNFSIPNASAQPVTRFQFVVIDFVLAGVDVDGGELAFGISREMRSSA
jgi:hypothetical protein